MIKKKLYCFLLAFVFGNAFAQSYVADSFATRLNTCANDMQKALLLNDFAWELQYSNPDSTILLSKQSLTLLSALGDKEKNLPAGKAGKLVLKNILKARIDALGIIGLGYRLKGDYARSLEFYNKALKLETKMGNKKRVSTHFGNIGIVYASQGIYTKALESMFTSLSINETYQDQNGIASDLGNIANIYQAQGDYPKALTYNFKVIKLNEQISDDYLQANTLGNIGAIYALMHESDKAITYFTDALKLNEKTQDKNGIAVNSVNLGGIYMAQNKYNEAMVCFTKALEIDILLGDQNGIAVDYGSMGSLHLKMKNYNVAEKHLLDALNIETTVGSLNGLKHIYDLLSQLYEQTGKHEYAFDYYRKFIAVRDSIANDENTKKQTQLEMQYEFDKKQSADSIKNVERANLEDQKHQTEIKQQKIYTWGGVILFGIMLIVAIVSFRAFRNKQKANIIIAQQKLLVEEKQREIIDSIKYASRIQKALLPSNSYIKNEIKRLNIKK